MNESCHAWMHHSHTWMSHSHIWMSHVTYEWDMSHMTHALRHALLAAPTRDTQLRVTLQRVMSHISLIRHLGMSHVTHECVTVTYERVLVTHKCFISLMNASYHEPRALFTTLSLLPASMAYSNESCQLWPTLQWGISSMAYSKKSCHTGIGHGTHI